MGEHETIIQSSANTNHDDLQEEEYNEYLEKESPATLKLKPIMEKLLAGSSSIAVDSDTLIKIITDDPDFEKFTQEINRPKEDIEDEAKDLFIQLFDKTVDNVIQNNSWDGILENNETNNRTVAEVFVTAKQFFDALPSEAILFDQAIGKIKNDYQEKGE